MLENGAKYEGEWYRLLVCNYLVGSITQRLEMVKVSKSGSMDQDTKAIGRITKLMDMADSSMLMAMSMRVIGRMTRLMGMESTLM